MQPSFSGTRDTSQVIGIENFKEENSDKKTNNNSLQSKLEELKRLKDKKLVSNEEYEKLRKKILDII
jgi:ADP-dependent phosphofructokinase/glucokinase